MSSSAIPRVGPEHGVVGTYGANHRATLTVRPGERFLVHTADRFAGLHRGEPLDPDAVGAMVGPIAIEGALPGQVLEIEVLAIRPLTEHAYVLASSGFGRLGERVEARTRQVEVGSTWVRWGEGRQFAAAPHIGKIGLAPAGSPRDGKSSGRYGGAISSTQVGPGASLFLEIACPEGLLTLEDVHARMGDGEAGASGVEMAAEVELCCRLHPARDWPLPLVLTATEVLVHGQGDDLDAAADAAIESMTELLMSHMAIDLTEAAMLVGAAVDLRVSFHGGRPAKVRAAVDRALVGL